MAKDQDKKLTPKKVQEDKDEFENLKNITGYTPTNSLYTIANGTTACGLLDTKEKAFAVAEKKLKTAHDEAVAAEWAFHNYMLGAKKQVIAQFGDDSNEIQSLGMKKKSEYKRPKRKT